jgi:hypothetical protein
MKPNMIDLTHTFSILQLGKNCRVTNIVKFSASQRETNAILKVYSEAAGSSAFISRLQLSSTAYSPSPSHNSTKEPEYEGRTLAVCNSQHDGGSDEDPSAKHFV